MPAAKKTPKRASRPKSKPNPLLLNVGRPISRKLGLAFLAVFVLIGGYVLYAASHASGTPEMALSRHGLCLDDYADRTANNSIVDVWTCNGSPAQQWVMSNNFVKVNGKCLDAQAWGTANGTHVNLYACNGQANQKWYWRTSGSGYELVNLHANKCLDDTAFGGKGTRVELWSCNGGWNQLWKNTTYTPPSGSTPSPTPTPPTQSSSPTPTPGPSVACSQPAVDNGTDTMNVSIATSTTYTMWVRMLASSAGNSVDAQVDDAACFHVGGGSSIPAGTWTWVNYQNGATGTLNKVALTAGSHTVELIGTDPNVEVDRVIFTSDACTPSGTGDNCLATPSPSASATPSSPTPTPSSSPSSSGAPAMPTAVPSGFSRAFSEDFNSSAALGSFDSVYGNMFGEYTGCCSTNKITQYSSAKVLYAQNGSMFYKLHSEGSTSYAAAPQPWNGKSFLYGQVGMSVKLDSSNGKGYKIAFLLWPATNQWTNEVDFPEVDPDFTAPIRAVSLNTTTSGGSHTFCGPLNTGYYLSDNKYHTFLLDWEPGKMTATIDGKLVETFPSSCIPTQAMRVSMQAEGWINQGSVPTGTTDVLEVPYVYINTKN